MAKETNLYGKSDLYMAKETYIYGIYGKRDLYIWHIWQKRPIYMAYMAKETYIWTYLVALLILFLALLL
jgi:hypothetical protein